MRKEILESHPTILQRLSVLCSLLIIQVALFAQTDPKQDTLDAKTLAPVTINASRLTSNDQQSALAVSVLDRAFIQDGQQQISLHESIETIPGVFSLNAENFAQDLRVAIRGFGARAAFGIRGIKVLVDGIPESTPDGQAQVDNLDMGIVERMEVIRGPASGLYGNASGGVIHIQTEQPIDPFVEGRITLGSYGLQRYQLKAGQHLGKFQYLVYGTHTQSKGYRANSGMKNNLINGRFQFNPDSVSALRLFVNYINSPQADDPGGIQLAQAEEDPQQARDRNVSFQSGETVTQGRVALAYERKIGIAHQIQARAYYLTRDFANKLPFEFGGLVELDRTYFGGGANYLFNGQIGNAAYRLNLGIDIDNQTDERVRFNNLEGKKGDMTLNQAEKFANTGIFLVQELVLSPKFRINLGTRFDAIQMSADDNFLSDGDDSGKLNFQRFSPTVGLVFSPSGTAHIYSNVSSSFETPALSELSANPNGSGGFNESLNPQKALNYEIGLRGLLGQIVKYDLAIFRIDLENELVPYELAVYPGRTFYRNAGNSTRMGVELGASIYLARYLTANLSYTYSDFAYKNYETTNGVFDGNTLPAIPRHSTYTALTYRHSSGFMARAQARFVGKMYADDANATNIGAYTVINARLAYPFQLSNWLLEPFIGANNLTNESYNSNIRINAFGQRYYEPAAGFAVFGGVRVRVGK